jgi:hypothetical protein
MSGQAAFRFPGPQRRTWRDPPQVVDHLARWERPEETQKGRGVSLRRLMPFNHAELRFLWSFYHTPLSNRLQLADSNGINNILDGL